jgi:hypothetical protein
MELVLQFPKIRIILNFTGTSAVKAGWKRAICFPKQFSARKGISIRRFV